MSGTRGFSDAGNARPLVVDIGKSIGEGRSPSIRLATIPLDVAREGQKYSLGGRFLWAIEAVGTSARLLVAFNEPTGSPIPFQRGIVLSGVAFDDLYLTNTAQPGQSITLLASMTLLDVTNAPALASLVKPEAANTVANGVVTVGATPTLAAPARPGRKLATLFAPFANTETVFIGGAGVALATGFPILAGGAKDIVGEEAVFAIRNAAAQTLYLFDEYTV